MASRQAKVCKRAKMVLKLMKWANQGSGSQGTSQLPQPFQQPGMIEKLMNTLGATYDTTIQFIKDNPDLALKLIGFFFRNDPITPLLPALQASNVSLGASLLPGSVSSLAGGSSQGSSFINPGQPLTPPSTRSGVTSIPFAPNPGLPAPSSPTPTRTSSGGLSPDTGIITRSNTKLISI